MRHRGQALREGPLRSLRSGPAHSRADGRARWRRPRRAEAGPRPRHSVSQPPAAPGFRAWLADPDLTLERCGQGDLELRLPTGGPSRYDVRHFVSWACERQLPAKLVVPPLRSGPGVALDADQ